MRLPGPRSILALAAFGGLWFAQEAQAQGSQAPTPVQAAQAANRAGTNRVRDVLTGEARAAFDRASTLFRAANFGGARVEFEQAHRLSGEPRVLYNVAVCDKELRRYARAVQSLRTSLAGDPSRLPSEYVTRVRETLAILEPLTARLRVEVNEPGAQILVDDEPAGLSPLPEPLLVDVGEHGIVGRKSGFLEARAVVSAASGQLATVRLALEPVARRAPLVARVRGAAVPGATVYVDGAEAGPAPFRALVDEGPHSVQIRAPGARSETRTLLVAGPEGAAVELPLVADAGVARLRVLVDEGAAVFVDGEKVGSGPTEREVLAGRHHIRVERPGEEPFVSSVLLANNETRTLHVDGGRRGPPAWMFVAGGAVVTAAVVTLVVVLTTSGTTYEGSTPGTLPPRIVLTEF